MGSPSQSQRKNDNCSVPADNGDVLSLQNLNDSPRRDEGSRCKRIVQQARIAALSVLKPEISDLLNTLKQKKIIEDGADLADLTLHGLLRRAVKANIIETRKEYYDSRSSEAGDLIEISKRIKIDAAEAAPYLELARYGILKDQPFEREDLRREGRDHSFDDPFHGPSGIAV